MHRAEILAPLNFAGVDMEPGNYLLDDAASGALLAKEYDRGQCRLWAERIPDRLLTPVPGETVTVLHPGGFGDLLWLNSVYERLPGVTIRHCCYPFYADVLKGFVSEVVPFPMRLLEESGVRSQESVMTLERLTAWPPCVGGEHPADRFAAAFGLPPGPKKAAYRVTAEETAQAVATWPRTDKPRVAVQAQSSVRLKGYPHIGETIFQLYKAGYEVLIVGAPQPPNGQQLPPEVFDCTTRGLPVRESFALASLCDVAVGADSALVHLAHALDIPVVGLFGPFEGKTYMAGYKGWWLQGRRPCSPCHMTWPDGRPAHCVEDCTALADIPVAEVVKAAGRMLEKYGRRPVDDPTRRE